MLDLDVESTMKIKFGPVMASDLIVFLRLINKDQLTSCGLL